MTQTPKACGCGAHQSQIAFVSLEFNSDPDAPRARDERVYPCGRRILIEHGVVTSDTQCGGKWDKGAYIKRVLADADKTN